MVAFTIWAENTFCKIIINMGFLIGCCFFLVQIDSGVQLDDGDYLIRCALVEDFLDIKMCSGFVVDRSTCHAECGEQLPGVFSVGAPLVELCYFFPVFEVHQDCGRVVGGDDFGVVYDFVGEEELLQSSCNFQFRVVGDKVDFHRAGWNLLSYWRWGISSGSLRPGLTVSSAARGCASVGSFHNE